MADDLNPEQRAAVSRDGHRCLTSCPGSGKTRTIIAKILRCLNEVRGTPRRIGCITYTNAAVDEIERRLSYRCPSDDSGCYEIGTIHSFCLKNTLRPYSCWVPALENGFRVVCEDDDWFHQAVADIINRHRLHPRTRDAFGQIQREPGGTLFVPRGLTEAAAREFTTRADEFACVTMNDIIFHSQCLVTENRFISRGLAARFAWLLVDEFQDTSACQAEILKEIHQHEKTKFFLVGDMNQSIYGFAGARPNLMTEVARHIAAETDIRMTGNYRCSSRVTALAEALCATDPPMQALGATRAFAFEPQYIHCRTMVDGIWEHFLPTLDELQIPIGDAVVLAPQWVPLHHLGRALRQRGVPVVGPGARPYRRSREYGQFAEAACAYLEQPDPLMCKTVQRALFAMLLNLTGNPPWAIYSYQGKRVLLRTLKIADSIRHAHPGAADWLVNSAQAISDVLVAEALLTLNDSVRLVNSAKSMVTDIQRQVQDVANLSTQELGLFARPAECLQLLTMHRAKGREFDAVAVVDLHEGKLPHFTATTNDEIDEAKRLLYVATTRARKVLMYFTDSSDHRNQPSRFLGANGLALITA